MKRALLAGLALMLNACPPSPVPPPNPDASDARAPSMADALVATTDAAIAQCQPACAALAAAGCGEGKSPECVNVLYAIDNARLERTPSGVPLTCAALAAVRTPADAQMLGLRCAP